MMPTKEQHHTEARWPLRLVVWAPEGSARALMPAWGFYKVARLPVCWRPGAAGCAGSENAQKECAGLSSEAVSVGGSG